MRSFIRTCLERPVGTTAFFLFVLALAAIAFVRLPVSLLPAIDYPALSVWTTYPEAGPHEVEQSVTRPVEGAVAGVGDVEEVTARSQIGASLIRLRFAWTADLDRKALEVREQIARLGDALPEEASSPVVLQMDPSQRPIMMLALRQGGGANPRVEAAAVTERPAGSRQDLVRLRQLGEEVVARRLEQLAGVARVRVAGGFDEQIEVRLREDRMATYGVTARDIRQALEQTNVSLPGGVVRRGPFRYAVEVTGEFENPEDVAQTVVARPGSTAALRLSDLADVRRGVESRNGLVRLNGREALLLLVERTAGANTVRTAEEVRTALSELRERLSGTRLSVVVDESQFIEDSISATAQAVWLGGLLAIIVLFLFLRRFRAVLAVGVAVPLSLALTFVCFDLAGVSFNLIALGGLALGVGMLVDNGIIVTENVARLREEGYAPMEAALEGTHQVSLAITASTLTTIAVFGPITFVEGLAGRLFQDQSLAVVFSLLASLIVAFTVVPLIVSRETGDSSLQGPRPDWLYEYYERLLTWSLRHRTVLLSGALVVLAGAAVVALNLPREVVPQTRQGRTEVHLRLPPESSVSLVSSRARHIEQEVLDIGRVSTVLADVGRRGEARLRLDPRPMHEADLTVVAESERVVDRVRSRVAQMDLGPDTELEVRPVRTRLAELLTPEGGDLIIDLEGENRRLARSLADSLMAALNRRPELTGVRRAGGPLTEAYEIHFNRAAITRSGVSRQLVMETLETATRGLRATVLKQTSRQIPIILRSAGSTSLNATLSRTISTEDGPRPLGQFVRAERVEIASELLRSDQAPVVRLVAGIGPDADIAGALGAVRSVFADRLPSGMRGEVGGANRAFRAGLRALGLSLLLSVLLVYLILAAQFESLLEPLVILAAVPLAAAGVAVVLAITGQSLNLMSLTGCVVLVGIVVNDAIVKVDFIDQRLAEGYELVEAIVEAGRQRLRPILMTTVTTAFGLLPLALGLGEGAELRAPLAIAIVGGLLSATVLTLFVVPVLYAVAAGVRSGIVPGSDWKSPF